MRLHLALTAIAMIAANSHSSTAAVISDTEAVIVTEIGAANTDAVVPIFRERYKCGYYVTDDKATNDTQTQNGIIDNYRGMAKNPTGPFGLQHWGDCSDEKIVAIVNFRRGWVLSFRDFPAHWKITRPVLAGHADAFIRSHYLADVSIATDDEDVVLAHCDKSCQNYQVAFLTDVHGLAHSALMKLNAGTMPLFSIPPTGDRYALLERAMIDALRSEKRGVIASSSPDVCAANWELTFDALATAGNRWKLQCGAKTMAIEQIAQFISVDIGPAKCVASRVVTASDPSQVTQLSPSIVIAYSKDVTVDVSWTGTCQGTNGNIVYRNRGAFSDVSIQLMDDFRATPIQVDIRTLEKAAALWEEVTFVKNSVISHDFWIESRYSYPLRIDYESPPDYSCSPATPERRRWRCQPTGATPSEIGWSLLTVLVPFDVRR